MFFAHHYLSFQLKRFKRKGDQIGTFVKVDLTPGVDPYWQMLIDRMDITDSAHFFYKKLLML